MAKQDDWVRITLRLPPELHAYLSEQAGAGSLNAEIVDRLHVSQGLDDAGNDILGVGAALSPAHQLPEINIRIDAQGVPISWDEIQAHVSGLADMLDKSAVAMNVIVETPELKSSHERREAAALLRQAWALQVAERHGMSMTTEYAANAIEHARKGRRRRKT